MAAMVLCRKIGVSHKMFKNRLEFEFPEFGRAVKAYFQGKIS